MDFTMKQGSTFAVGKAQPVKPSKILQKSMTLALEKIYVQIVQLRNLGVTRDSQHLRIYGLIMQTFKEAQG